MYAVLDIETTGGQYNQEGITEIAIYKFDGTEVVDQFISLVNPEIPIQPFVVKLTGINNAMLRLAPKFFEIAKRIVEITEDCIIVAHNADFDYRILKMEFRRLGYNFIKPSLCTVELSKKLLPDAASYSLGKLSRSLGIPTPDRHRANGDAMATVKLFRLLLGKDKEKEILKTLVKTEVSKGLMQKWIHILDGLPSSTGIFYIHNDKSDIIYLGKSTNIYKKITQLFTGNSRICKRIQNEVFRVKFEETGNELIATLKEREEMNVLKPTLNVGQRKSPFLWGLYADKLKNGNLQLVVSKLDGRKREIRAFKNIQNANEFLVYTLKKLGLDVFSENEERNKIISNFIQQEHKSLQNVVIILKGRKVNEKSALWIENGIIQGYCFFDLNYQITQPQVLRNIIIPLQHTREAINFIKYYLHRKKDFKVIRF